VLDLALPVELYDDDRRRTAIPRTGRGRMLRAWPVWWLRVVSTIHLHHGKSVQVNIAGRRECTPRPEAAERPAPQRATTRFAFARLSRNDCISSGVIMDPVGADDLHWLSAGREIFWIHTGSSHISPLALFIWYLKFRRGRRVLPKSLDWDIFQCEF